MTQILTSDTLATLSGVRHAFFTKTFGSGGLSEEINAENTRESTHESRSRMAAHLAVELQNFVFCHQVHSSDVITVGHPWSVQDRPQADALVTNRRGVALGILTADCVPVLFADKHGDVIGAAHAGWRGAIGGVLENTLDAMEELGARRKHIYAALGPCIWQNSYEVGPEFPAPFLAEEPGQARFFRPAFKSDRYMFDLPGYVVAKLRSLGVGSVQGSAADTCAAPERFFSHRHSTLRNEKRGGNLMSAIALI
jgi:YfiH family protein